MLGPALRLLLLWSALTVGGLLSGLTWSQSACAEEGARLTGKVGNYSAYFLEDERLRHHRYELYLKQDTHYTFRLSSVIEGRLRFDAALLNDREAPRRDYSKAVRDDEMAEGEARQLYLDYLGDSFRMTAGMQLIDWVDSLSPLANDVLTPVDLRFGGFGDASDVLVPVGALRLNHKIFFGSLDWLIVPLPAHSRLPAGPNGYGIYEAAAKARSNPPQTFVEKPWLHSAKDTELGVRYLADLGGLETTLLAYRGHRKTPSFASEVLSQTSIVTTSSYPIQNTYGGFLTYSQNAWVARGIYLYEPHRAPDSYTVYAPFVSDPYERRTKFGLGFDYVFSKHLKVYTEQYDTHTERLPGLTAAAGAKQPENPRNDYTAVMRFTNETFNDTTLSLEALFTSPRKSEIIMPQISRTFASDYEINLGARLIRSWNPESPYENLKNASQVYVSLYRHFAIGS